MILNENNECDWLYLAPNDAHGMKKGNWDFDSQTGELKILQDGEIVMNLQVVDIGENLIKIKNN
jgi:hypothetical protein